MRQSDLASRSASRSGVEELNKTISLRQTELADVNCAIASTVLRAPSHRIPAGQSAGAGHGDHADFGVPGRRLVALAVDALQATSRGKDGGGPGSSQAD